MTLLPDPWWLPTLLVAALAVDVALSIRPVKFIVVCLEGVGLPRDWWWVLIVVKLLAIAGLVAGFWIPGVGLAACVGVVAYFSCAVFAHLRARFLGQLFWVNCLGMLTLAVGTLLVAFLL